MRNMKYEKHEAYEKYEATDSNFMKSALTSVNLNPKQIPDKFQTNSKQIPDKFQINPK